MFKFSLSRWISMGACVLVPFCVSQQAQAIDFKIDMPPDQGKVARTAKTSGNQDNSELNRPDEWEDVTLADESHSVLDVPPATTPPLRAQAPSLDSDPQELGEQEQPQQAQIERTKPAPMPRQQEGIREPNSTWTPQVVSSSFPTPRCLVSRVQFWEHVYRDVDVNQAILHDREDLSRIYGVATLPAGGEARRRSMSYYENYFQTKLKSLAGRIDTPEQWDKADRELAKFFPDNALTAQNLLRAATNIRSQTGLKSRFEGGVQRSLNYLPLVQSIISQYGLPVDIAFLPHVESGYHPHAVSKVGAVGLWQIMPDTMRLLMGSTYVHRRTDPAAATEGAARLLSQNYRATQSWPLALTAYNHGLYGVLRAVKQTGSRDLCEIIARYESPSFRFASSNFYAQFLAARNVSLQRYRTLAQEGIRVKGMQNLLSLGDSKRH